MKEEQWEKWWGPKENYETRINSSQCISENAKRLGNRPALIYKEELSWKEYNGRVCKIANGLYSLGAKPGDRIGFLGNKNTNEEPEIVGACVKGGFAYQACTPNPVVEPVSHIRYLLDNCETFLLFYDDDYEEVIVKVQPQLKHPVLLINLEKPTPEMNRYLDTINRAPSAEPGYSYSDGDFISCGHTTGTTGQPKVVGNHPRAIYNTVATHVECCDLTEEDRWLTALPTYWSVFCCGWYLTCFVTGTTIICPGERTPVSLMKAIESHRVTAAHFSPMELMWFLDHPDVSKYDLSSMRVITYLGILPVEYYKKADGIFGKKIIHVLAGTNEAGVPLYLRPEEYDYHGYKAKRLRSVGHCSSTAKAWIFDPETRKPLAPGELGILGYYGPITEYWRNPEETSQVYENGWFFSDDVAYADECAYFYMKGKLDQMLRVGGKIVVPEDTNEIIKKHPAVKDAAVVSIPDKKLGELLVAGVVSQEGEKVTKGEIIEMCKQELPSGSPVPEDVVFIDNIPRQYKGILLARELKERIIKERASRGDEQG